MSDDQSNDVYIRGQTANVAPNPHEDGLKAVHGILSEAYKLTASLYPVKHPISGDTAFAIGEATGILSRAKALVGRDIDDLRSRK